MDAGENIEFAIVVSNNGTGTARAVTLVDNLPSGTAGPWTIDTSRRVIPARSPATR